MMNNTICSAFWNHTNVRSGNRIFPCCRFKYPVDKFDGNLSKILDSNEYEKLRQNSLVGIEIAGCNKCYLEERLGKKSLRQEFNEQYDCTTVKLRYLEIGFDNICNLSCDGCWEEWSSTWASIKYPDKKFKELVVSTNEITDVPETIEKIVFLGGEPLMTNRHYKFLKKINRLSTVDIIYYTNGMFMLSNEIIEILKIANSVKFILSVDAVGELNEKIRKGSNWTQILKFINQVSNSNFNLSIHSVIHKNSWIGLTDLYEFVYDNNLEWTIGVLTYPEHLSIKNLSFDEKMKFEKVLSKIKIPNEHFIKGFIKND